MTEQPAPAPSSASTAVEKGKALARSKGVRITAATLAALFLIFGALGYLWLPGFAKARLEALLSEEFARPVSVEKIEVSPYTLSATIRGFSVGQKGAQPGQFAGKGPEAELFGFDSLYVNISSASLFRAIPVVSEVTLKGPRLNLSRGADGRLSVSDLLDKWLAGPSSPTPQFSVANISIDGGSINFNDEMEGARHEVTELSLGIPFIANTSGTVESSVQPKFSAKVNGAALALAGAVKPFAPGKDASIELNVHDFDLMRVFKYAPANLPFALRSGRLDTKLAIAFAKPEGKDAAVRLSGDVTLREAALALPNAKGQTILLTLGKADLRLDEATLAGALRAGLSLAELALRKDGAKEPFAGFGGLDIAGIKASTAERKAEVAEVKLAKPFAVVRRAEGGEIDLAAALDGVGTTRPAQKQKPQTRPEAKSEAKPAAKVVEKAADKPVDKPAGPWAWSVGKVTVAEGSLRYTDETLGAKVKPLAVEALALALEGLSSASAPARFNLSSRVNEHGEVKISGTAQPAPLKADLDMDLKQVDLVALQGFAMGDLNAVLTRGELNVKGRLAVDGSRQADSKLVGSKQAGSKQVASKVTAAGADGAKQAQTGPAPKDAAAEAQQAAAPAVTFKGDVALIDFSVLDKANSADLLRWRSLRVTGIDAGTAPLRASIDEINLANFFVRLMLTPEGRLNLNDVMRKQQIDAQAAAKAADKADKSGKTGKAAKTEAPAAAAPQAKPAEAVAGPAPSPATATKSQTAAAKPAEKKGPAPDIRIGRIVLSGGGINFADRFIKPNYTANLTDLSGRIGTLKAGALTDVSIKGKVDRTGPLDISGKVDPLGQALNLDIRAKATGIEMSGFSPYSGRYVGYVIEKGKLSVDLRYLVQNGTLEAENNVFLDQLTFGKKVESPDALGIPIGLVVALLKNNRGEIDINLPIKGSLDDPQFSIGGIIVKVLLNLLTKAATSPFTLLASLFGGGEELSYVAFDPGASVISPQAEKQLETMAKALRERSALKLEVAGAADPAREEEGLKRARLMNRVKALKATDLARQGKTSGSVSEITLTPEEYAKYLERVYKAGDFKKPRNIVGLAKTLPVEQMEELIVANTQLDPGAMERLAQDRGVAVQAWLVDKGGVEQGRVFLLAPRVGAEPPKGAPAGGRADFSLR
ncbi:MAG: DUF748 domain-containing protein [Desulfovibrio sp.]|jgi:hypothetical protein|nr:DUF748 domain-containing protein [Desulfovibrio sp.]